jgi:hypothetical protein
MEQIPAVLSQLGDYRLEVLFITDVLKSEQINPISNLELLIAQGISNCIHFGDPVLECESNIRFTLILPMTLQCQRNSIRPLEPTISITVQITYVR